MASPEDRAKRLHDKATRGGVLSADEQVLLDAWYAEQDRTERALLESTDSLQHLDTLRTQVETVMEQLVTVSQRIQALTLQNETIRQEIHTLQHQLAQIAVHKSA